MLNELLIKELSEQVGINTSDIKNIKDAEIYSTSEVKTNKTWLGKALYRKVLTRTGAGDIDVSNLNIETGFIDETHSHLKTGRWNSVNTTTTSLSNEGTYMTGAFFNTSFTTLTVEKGSAITLTDVVITIEYTKTTD